MTKRNSLIKIGVVTVLLMITLALIGCQSFPKPRSDSDFMFVVPVVYLDSQSAPSRDISFGYKIALENVQTGQRKYVTVDSIDSYIYVRNWDEGEYLIKEYTTMGFMANQTYELEIQQYLKLEKGKIAIFPCKVVIFLLESASLAYDTLIYVDFMPLEDDDYKRIREYLGTYENYHFWNS